jgi:hypothetical protein
MPKPPYRPSRRELGETIDWRGILRRLGLVLMVLPVLVLGLILVAPLGWGTGKDYGPGLDANRYFV